MRIRNSMQEDVKSDSFPTLDPGALERQAREVSETMAAIRTSIHRKDTSGRAWILRALTMRRMFQIMNEPRFRLEPVNLQVAKSALVELLELVEETPVHRGGGDSEPSGSTPAAARDLRMQVLYGLAWSQLSDAQFADAADLLRQRLVASNLSLDFLRGAKCVDVGTGIARFALAMVQLGAREVLAFDFSEECLAEARRRLSRVPESENIELRRADIYELPADWNESFDFVCANGVIHHMAEPEKALHVCHRLLRRGGCFFVFVFAGNDSPWWQMIEIMREIMAPVPVEYAAAVLHHSGSLGTVAFNVLDYSYTPIQYKHPASWYEDVFDRIGFSVVHRLQGGAIHDSDMRSRLFHSDRALYGVSEVRYLLRK